MSNPQTFEIESDWVHIQYPETSAFRDVYGFASQSGMVNIEGIRLRPKGKPSKTLLFYMHPASTLQILPVPKSMALVARTCCVRAAAMRATTRR